MRTALGTALAATLLAAGCGTERIPADTAQALLADSRAVEARLAAGDRCGADRRAQSLAAKAKVAIQAGLVPVSLAGELRARTLRLAAALTCPPPPPPPPPPAAEPQPPPAAVGDEGDGNEKGNEDHGHGKKRGHHK
jgi:hypothetical protein